ncbi:MAG: hypothetical protein ACLPYS_13360, partial [Vulcanimicrobiaceae bacterium]
MRHLIGLIVAVSLLVGLITGVAHRADAQQVVAYSDFPFVGVPQQHSRQGARTSCPHPLDEARKPTWKPMEQHATDGLPELKHIVARHFGWLTLQRMVLIGAAVSFMGSGHD